MVDACRLHKPEQGMPEGSFPLPRIDHVVDLTAWCKLLSFIDARSGYHQIPLAEVDQPATTFMTPFRCFYYVKMSFELKNAGGTYQRCMQSCFEGQIGRNLEVYINDIIIKTRQGDGLLPDLEETFTNLKRFNIRLNPKNAPLVSPEINFWGTSSPSAASKQILTRSRSLPKWVRS
jgi:hypothetical protein